MQSPSGSISSSDRAANRKPYRTTYLPYIARSNYLGGDLGNSSELLSLDSAGPAAEQSKEQLQTTRPSPSAPEPPRCSRYQAASGSPLLSVVGRPAIRQTMRVSWDCHEYPC